MMHGQNNIKLKHQC